MTMTNQYREFSYYCLDRLKPLTEELRISYNDGNIIKRILYKVGLRATIKHQDCFILYTDSEEDLDKFIYIAADTFFNYQWRFFNEVLSISEFKEIVKCLTTINIFEYTSLLDFSFIYNDFKQLIEYNWESLNMNKLIEI